MSVASVLFVDDDPNFLKALKRAFAREEWRMRFISSGPEALKVFAEEGPFDVVVADQRMPSMTGVELLKTIRRLHPSSVRVILSGYADIEHVLDAINEGHIYKFLMKDITEEALRETIRDVVRAITLAHENRRLAAALEGVRRESEAVERLVADIGAMDFDPLLESALGAALEALPAPALVTDMGGVVIYANREARTIFDLAGVDYHKAGDRIEALKAAHPELKLRGAEIDHVGSHGGKVWLALPETGE